VWGSPRRLVRWETVFSAAVDRPTAMSDFETYECANCGEAFKAHPSANAATRALCSPRCDREYDG